MGAPRSARPPMGPKEGGLRHPFPRPIKRREAPHLRLFKRAVNARPANAKRLRNLSSTYAGRFHFPHLVGHLSRLACPSHARGLGLRNALKLTFTP